MIDHWERGFTKRLWRISGEPILSSLQQSFYQSFGAALAGVIPSRLVADLYELATLRWKPSVADWWEAGRLVRNIGDSEGWDINKRRDFQNDALIALTARRHGATIVTANSSDFELLQSELRISVLAAR